MSKKGIWVTWENQRRNKGISAALGFTLFEFVYNESRIIRYVKSIAKTINILIQEKPEIVVAQNPSILLATLVVLLKHVFHYKCVIDAHNAGLFPCDNKITILTLCSKMIQRLADITIVTNEQLASIVKNNGGTAIVLPDKIPDLPINIEIINLRGATNIVFICSFSSDEPFNEVIEAAKHLPEDITIYITGKYTGKVDPDTVPSNVVLAGFIPESEYWSLISSADAIMVLTTRENCLVCGAYEAVSIRKPMILSKTSAIMDYFSLGCMYTSPDSINIQKAILGLTKNKDNLILDVELLHQKLNNNWNNYFTNLLTTLGK